MNNKLTTFEKTLPIRYWPEDKLNRAVLMDFLPWVSNLLSLSGETSAERLEIALPALKAHCLGMGFVEIKNMFEFYADGKLNIEPIPNYFDRILLGKIVNAYRRQKPQNKTHPATTAPTEAEKERIMLDAVDRVKKVIQETGNLEGTAHHVYDFLIKTGRLERPAPEVSEKYIAQAKEITRKHIQKKLDNATDLAGRRLFQNALKMFEKTGTIQKNLAKTLFIIDHFKKTSA